MHKEFQILKVNDIFEYKLSKLIHSLLTGTPKLPETLDKLIVRMDSIHTRNTRNKHQVYSKKENKAIGKRQLKCQPSKTWNSYPIYIKTTETHSQFKTAFYEWKLDGYTTIFVESFAGTTFAISQFFWRSLKFIPAISYF